MSPRDQSKDEQPKYCDAGTINPLIDLEKARFAVSKLPISGSMNNHLILRSAGEGKVTPRAMGLSALKPKPSSAHGKACAMKIPHAKAAMLDGLQTHGQLTLQCPLRASLHPAHWKP